MKLVVGQTGIETVIEPWMPPNACLVVGEKEVVYFRDGKTEIMSRTEVDEIAVNVWEKFVERVTITESGVVERTRVWTGEGWKGIKP